MDELTNDVDEEVEDEEDDEDSELWMYEPIEGIVGLATDEWLEDQDIYASPAEAITGISYRLVEGGANADLAQHLVEQLIMNRELPLDFVGKGWSAQEYNSLQDQGICPLLMPALWRAIRDDDLNVLQCIGSGVTAAAGTSFFLDSQSAKIGPLTAIAVAIFQLISRIRRKGVKLDLLQTQILVGLQSVNHGKGMTAQELAQALSSRKLTESGDWTESEIEEQLQILTKVRANDGSVIGLVAQAADKAWSASGV